MSDFLYQRFQALAVVLTTPYLAYHQRELRLAAFANQRGASIGAIREKQQRVKAQRKVGEYAGEIFRDNVSFKEHRPPFHVVRLVRIAPRALDTDNIENAFKAVRDGVAKAIGVDDRDPRVRYVVDQCNGAPREYAVRIELYAAPAAGDMQVVVER